MSDRLRPVFLCEGIRTPIGRYGGMLSPLRADDLAAMPIRHLISALPNLDPAAIEEVFFGCANQAGEDNRNVARMSALLAGLPDTVPGVTINRLCASGLEAVGQGARAVASGEMNLCIVGGVESMSRAPFVMGKAQTAFQRTAAIEDSTIGWRFVNPAMETAYGIDSMPQTAENVADAFGISREDQDAFALRSQERTSRAIASGAFSDEIMHVTVPGRKGAHTVVAQDEHPRATTLSALSALPAIVRPGGSVTAGNASGVNDGAAAIILASESAVLQHGLVPKARILGMASAGVSPRIMGIGPVPATGKLLHRLGYGISQIDQIELNEAFASQALAVLRGLGLPDDAEHVNSYGGAIALGHPLGMSGARLALTLAGRMHRTGAKLGLITLCVGVGQGLAVGLAGV
jgi:3-oxoadipyl-CoA thiolase